MNFSRRTSWNLRPNALASRIESLRAQGAQLIDLTDSNPTRCELAYPREAIESAIRGAALLTYQPEPNGLLAARQAISAHLSRKEERVDPEHLIICSGTSDAYGYLFKLLCNPGDSVLVPNPSYPLFDFLTGLEGIEGRPYALRFEGGWCLQADALAEAADATTRAVLVVSPGNPTGAFLKRSELEAVETLCADRSWALIVDEVFSDYGFGDDADRVATVAGRASPALTFALSGFSKLAGLPQLKVSWLSASGPAQLRDEALQRLEIVADTYLSGSPILQSAVAQLLPLAVRIQSQIRNRVAENRAALLRTRAADARWNVLPSEGGWCAVIRIPDERSEETVCLQLLERGVIVHPGYFFDFPSGSHLIVSLILPRDAFARGIEALVSVLG